MESLRTIRRCSGIVALYLIAACGPKGQGAESQQAPGPIYLTVRLRPDVKGGTLDYLGEITEPQSAKVNRGESLATIVKRYYGYSTRKLKRLVSRSNPGGFVSGKASGDQIELPLGPRGVPNADFIAVGPLTVRQIS